MWTEEGLQLSEALGSCFVNRGPAWYHLTSFISSWCLVILVDNNNYRQLWSWLEQHFGLKQQPGDTYGLLSLFTCSDSTVHCLDQGVSDSWDALTWTNHWLLPCLCQPEIRKGVSFFLCILEFFQLNWLLLPIQWFLCLQFRVPSRLQKTLSLGRLSKQSNPFPLGAGAWILWRSRIYCRFFSSLGTASVCVAVFLILHVHCSLVTAVSVELWLCRLLLTCVGIWQCRILPTCMFMHRARNHWSCY